MKFSATHITVMVCTLLVGLFASILHRDIIVPVELVKETGALAIGLLAGALGIKRPGDTPVAVAQQAIALAKSVPPPPLTLDVK